MGRKKRSSDFPYFTEYVAYLANQRIGQGPKLWHWLLVLALSIAAGVVGFSLPALISPPANAVVMYLSLLAFGGGALSLGGKWIYGKKRAAASQPRQEVEAVEAAREFHRLVLKKRLTSWVDPVALELLEAGAFHHRRVADIIERWPSTAGGHWNELRDQARHAADDAMHELLRMFVKCIGKPQKQRKDAWGDVLEDFADLDFVDALEGLKRISDGDWRDYAYTSPVTQRLFEPGRQIAEKLKTLADEIERTLSERSADGFIATESSSSIDGVLGQISAVRQAEEELREHQPRG